MIAAHLQPRLHAGEQEGHHTHKKSRRSHPPLGLGLFRISHFQNILYTYYILSELVPLVSIELHS